MKIAFKLTSKKTGRVLIMDEIGVCHEYSCLTFSSSKEDEDGLGSIDEFQEAEGCWMSGDSLTNYFDIELIKEQEFDKIGE